MPKNLIFLLLLFSWITVSNASIDCNGTTIDHCVECDSSINSNLCSKCEDKYFLFYEDNSCKPCDDAEYGQEGCEGNCNGTNYEKDGFPFCEKEGCKEGYYNFDGQCKECSKESQGCGKCSYDVPENMTEGEFKCLECESDEYLLTDSNKCEKCRISFCDKCHYNGTKEECDKCQDNFYINSEGECSRCRTIYINGGKCTSCSDNDADIVEDSCYCDPKYAQDSNSNCFICPDNCHDCDYNETIKDTKCIKCYKGYTLNNKGKCIPCVEGCSYCDYNEKDDNTICLSCNNGLLFSNNTCPTLLQHCDNNIIKPSEKDAKEEELICSKCDNYKPLLDTQITLDPNNECSQCPYEDVGYQCSYCQYDDIKLRYVCFACWSEFYDVYVKNEFKCYDNKYNEDPGLYGCLNAIYNNVTKKYECLECARTFIPVFDKNNNFICLTRITLNLKSDCNEAENLGTLDNPIYSCTKCGNSYYTLVIVDSTNQIKDCFYRNYNTSFCEEGIIDKEGNYKCIKCTENAHLNNLSICECDYDSFGKDKDYCYKCDDEGEGNPGCISEKGCEYYKPFTTGELKCNECKEGYFKNKDNICEPCNLVIPNCGKCHLNEEEKVICDNCSNIYIWNEEKGECVLNECEEYPEVAPGCIICKDKLDEYKINNKCQKCKYGYFKTKNESCIYCRSEEYGGPGCYECGYEKDENGTETDNIICNYCFSMNFYDPIHSNYRNKYYYFDEYRYEYFFDSLLSSDKKCYISRLDLFDPCLTYEFIKDKNNEEKLSCTICSRGYYLDSNGKCISFIDKIEFIPNCEEQILHIGGYIFNYYPYREKDKIKYKNMNDYFKYFPIFNEYIRDKYDTIKSNCLKCQNRYFLNNQAKCENFTVEKCTGQFIIQNNYERWRICNELCQENEYLPIYLKIINGRIDFNFENFNSSSDEYNIYDFKTIYEILNDFNIINDTEIKEFILNNPICYYLSDEKLKDKYDGCKSVVYIPKTKSFQCIECNREYNLDDETHLCNKDYSSILRYCDTENIGNKSHPIYSCKNCRHDYEILITFDNGAKDCHNYRNYEYDSKDIYAYSYCKEAIASSRYVDTYFNCTYCANNYTPAYSEKYDQILCVLNNSEEIDGEEKKFDLKDEPNTEVKNEGTCEYDSFTPDGKLCYKCNSTTFGNPGCKGNCIFKPKGTPSVLCDECEPGYFELYKGICKPCNSYLDKKCEECHYVENFYLNDKIEVNRTRSLVCNKCKEGYLLTKEGKCTTCSKLFRDCEKCEKNEITGDYDCIECKNKNHGLNEKGYCDECKFTKFVLKGKCIKCGDVDNGGIANCTICQGNDEGNETNGAICKQCDEEFILLTDNNTCLYRENNTDLEQFNSCFELTLKNGKFTCSRCKPLYSLLKTENNESICTYTPSLYDANFVKAYHYKYYYETFKKDYREFRFYSENDNNLKQAFHFPCKESINLGSKENPIYSCVKCYDVFKNDELDKEYYNYINNFYDVNHYDDYFIFYFQYYYEKINKNNPIKINDLTKNNISYCIHGVYFTKYCKEASYSIFNGTEIYNCSKCKNNYYLTKDETLNSFYCSDTPSVYPDSSNNQPTESNINPSNPSGSSSESEKSSTKQNDTNINPSSSSSKPGESSLNPSSSSNKPGESSGPIIIPGESSPNPSSSSNKPGESSPNPSSSSNDTKETDKQNISDKPSNDQTDIIETDIQNQCLVDKCQSCIPGNNFFCQNCISSDLEVNKFSGSCIKKIEFAPSITMKDIFGFNMHTTKKRNGRNISGPLLFLRGITSSQVPQNHAFIIIFVFELIGLRNLEEGKVKVPAICETNNELEKTDSSTNIIDYECLGNTTIDENKYQFNGIEEVEGNDGISLISNLDSINNIIKEEKDNLAKKTDSEYTAKDLPSVFKYESTKNDYNYYASNKIFNIALNGEMTDDKGIPKGCNKAIVDITKINDEPESSFCLDSNKKGTFNFLLEMKKETEDKIIQFKSSIIKIPKNRVRYLANNNENYEINIPGLERINLIYNQTTTPEEEQKSYRYPRKSSSSNNGWKIAVGIIAGVIGLIGVAIVIICLRKFGKKNKEDTNATSSSVAQNIGNSIDNLENKI